MAFSKTMTNKLEEFSSSFPVPNDSEFQLHANNSISLFESMNLIFDVPTLFQDSDYKVV